MAGILEDLTNLKTDEEKITNNKVSNFAYTNKAYEDNDADGVEVYSISNENNIPVSAPSIIQTNSNVLFKGFRTKSSSVARMLVNHFFGRVSYNLNKVNDNFHSLIEKLISSLGTANGLATLDASGRIPSSQLPESAMEFKGTWNAETNTPTLSDGTGTKGDMYVVSVAGTQDLGSGEITFLANDRVVYNGSAWTKLSGGDVRTVDNIEPDSTGNVAITSENVPFSSTEMNDFPTAIDIKVNTMFKIWISKFLGRAWKQSNVLSDFSFQNACYGNGLWVASGDGLWYSTDGKTWVQSSRLVGEFFGVAYYGNGVWVACSHDNNGLYYSTDGMNWTQSNISSGYFYGGARYGNGVWVACDTYNGLWYSTDGKTWEHSNLSSGNFGGGAHYGNSLWVACSDDNNGLYYSTDGMTWTKSNITSGNFGGGSYYGNGVWVACSYDTHGLYYSTDGMNWTQSNITSADLDGGVQYANGVWIACGDDIFYSTDGKTWIEYNLGNFSGGAHYANSVWVACSCDAHGLWYSSVDDLIESGSFTMITD